MVAFYSFKHLRNNCNEKCTEPDFTTIKNNKFLGYRSLDSIRYRGDFFTTALYCSYSAISYGCWQFEKEFRMVHTHLSPPSYLLHTAVGSGT
jgi:hypothetical protein